MKIGVTGTRSGMTDTQKIKFETIIKFNFFNTPASVNELHHGDYMGVDVEAAHIARGAEYKIICHPPIVTDLRGYFKSDKYRSPLTYFQRNRNIVDETDYLFVLPYQSTPQKSGGTWYTYDYARKKNKPILVIYPDGRVVQLVMYIDKEPTLDEIL